MCLENWQFFSGIEIIYENEILIQDSRLIAKTIFNGRFTPFSNPMGFGLEMCNK